jgi:hypothetical protein
LIFGLQQDTMLQTTGRSSMRTLLATGVITALGIAAAHAAEPAKATAKKYVVPRTEAGQPDLRGVWNYGSDTPFERPAQFKDREFLTPEEAAATARQIRDRSAQIEAGDSGTPIDPTGGYNQFWMDYFGQGANLRTSLVIDPPDGRVPAVQSGVKVENGGLGPDTNGVRPVRFRVGGIRKDGPEDRGLSERCLMGFSSGPPFVPSLYNNIVQIFQTKTHAVILTEMIHDARIVPLDGRPALDAELTQWSGDSRGRWEGATLVVETRNFASTISSRSTTRPRTPSRSRRSFRWCAPRASSTNTRATKATTVWRTSSPARARMNATRRQRKATHRNEARCMAFSDQHRARRHHARRRRRRAEQDRAHSRR